MPSQPKDLTMISMRGGLNVTDPPTALGPEQCVEATNVVFDEATVGARRLGCTPIDLSTTFAAMTEVTFLHRHLPTNDMADAQLWAMASDGVTVILAYKDTIWHVVTPLDPIDPAYRYSVRAQTLHNNLFIAYRSTSGLDRLHVWDGTSLRRTGIAEANAAPTAANSGSGSFIGTRYYRVRFTKKIAGITVLRSEPSSHLTFAPSGSGTGVIVTRPTVVGEGETHWELEASTDNTLFYRIETIVIATTTSTADTTDYVAGYAQTGVLSEDIGDYDLLHSPKVVTADQDRLIIAGSFENTELASRVAWTPVFNAPGVGNDERSPIDENNFLDLDTSEGGPITDMSRTVNSYIAVFKKSHIYRLVRTGLRERAYDVFAISKDRGAIPGSLVEAVDQSGSPALYFLDENVGPCRLGVNGLKTCGTDLFKLWGDSVNINATVVSRGVYYPKRNQIRWCVATGSSEKPDLQLILQIDEQTDMADGVRNGWSTATGASATALAMITFSDNIDDDVDRNLDLKPFLGITGTSSTLIQMGDTGNTDNGVAYVATLLSRPHIPFGLLSKFGVRAGAVLAKSGNTDVVISLTRNFGLETRTFTVDLSPVLSEVDTIKPIDQLALSECVAVQIGVTDGPSGVQWKVNGVALKIRAEEDA